MQSRLCTLLLPMLLCGILANAQNTRLKDHNRIGWWTGFVNIKLTAKWSAHGEYQWRREQFVTHWQQSLLRVGLSWQVRPEIQLRSGYAWAETYNYGDYPINGFGKDFTEHRFFEMITLSDKHGRLELSQRFMLEQRWLGRYSAAELKREDSYAFVNRLRYLLRLQYPLKGKTLDNREFYAACYNEILIGFGKNVNENVFDQNRLGLLLGYRFNPRFRLEGGYLNQVVQLSREIVLPGSTNGRNVFQHNNGFVINSIFNLDWSR